MLSRRLLYRATIIHSSVIPAPLAPSAHVSQRLAKCSLPGRISAPQRTKIPARWYAAPAEAEQAPTEEAKQAEGEAQQPAEEVDPVQSEMQKKDREIIDLKDRYLRSVADFRNLQERSRREQTAAREFAISKFARDLIESVDNLDLALSNVPEEKLQAPQSEEDDRYKELRELHGGLKMTSSILLSTLSKHGLERHDPSINSEMFDPNLHEASFQAPQPDLTDGTVFHTVQKGFTLNGRVIRAPKVGVVKNS